MNYPEDFLQTKFEDRQRVNRNRKSKDMQYNDEKTKRQTLINKTQH